MKDFQPGDVVRIMQSTYIDGNLEKTGEYTLGQIVEEISMIQVHEKILRAFKVYCGSRKRVTHRTELFLEPASKDETSNWRK